MIRKKFLKIFFVIPILLLLVFGLYLSQVIKPSSVFSVNNSLLPPKKESLLPDWLLKLIGFGKDVEDYSKDLEKCKEAQEKLEKEFFEEGLDEYMREQEVSETDITNPTVREIYKEKRRNEYIGKGVPQALECTGKSTGKFTFKQIPIVKDIVNFISGFFSK